MLIHLSSSFQHLSVPQDPEGLPSHFPLPYFFLFPFKETREMGRDWRSCISFFHLNLRFLSQMQKDLIKYIFIVTSFSQKCRTLQKIGNSTQTFQFPTHRFSYNLEKYFQPSNKYLVQNTYLCMCIRVCAVICKYTIQLKIIKRWGRHPTGNK